MSVHPLPVSTVALASLIDAVSARFRALPGEDRRGYVSCELAAVDRVLRRIRRGALAPGPIFCDWGSGLGGVCGVAALHGFTPSGIEIQRELVDSARALAADLDLEMTFAEGTFLLPGDEGLAAGTEHTHLAFDGGGWAQLDVAPADCDVVFAYPWPGDEACVERVFSRHASSGALLLTFHATDRVLVQRKIADDAELATLGWM